MQRVGMDSPLTRLKVPSDAGDTDTFTSLLAYTKGCFFLKECEYAVGHERFDEFIQTYMKSFQFQSLTTEEFLDFLKAELPQVFEQVDVETWVYKPGMPETWHKPHSHLHEEVQKVLNDIKQGKLPTQEQVKDWHRYQILLFLQGLPNTLSAKEYKQLEKVFEFEKRNDDHFYSYFYAASIASGDQDSMPRIEKFIEKIGRLLYIMPVIRAMLETDWARGRVRPLLERVREKHHPVTIAAIERLLRQAEL
jgi:hypothetical protein